MNLSNFCLLFFVSCGNVMRNAGADQIDKIWCYDYANVNDPKALPAKIDGTWSDVVVCVDYNLQVFDLGLTSDEALPKMLYFQKYCTANNGGNYNFVQPVGKVDAFFHTTDGKLFGRVAQLSNGERIFNDDPQTSLLVGMMDVTGLQFKMCPLISKT